jgi:DNA-binding IclR family transcriptional regulator
MAIQSVNRALDILFLFSGTTPFLGITEISRSLNLNKPTVHGLVQTLAKRDLLRQDTKTKKYSLGMKIYELGTYLSNTLKVNQMGAIPAHRLANATKHMARISIWDKDSALVTLSIIPGSTVWNYQHLGPQIPAYCSASGKAILASFPEKEKLNYLDNITFTSYTENTITDKKYLLEELNKIHRNGFAVDHEEYMPGLACISSPIFDHTEMPVGAISLSAIPEILFNNTKLEQITQEIKNTATEISCSMGFTPKRL